MIRLHHIQHVPFEGLGSIGTWAGKAGCEMSSTHLYRGDSLPATKEIDWLVVMGGPMNIYEEDKYRWLTAEKKFIEQMINQDKTVIGICLRAQLLADILGQKVYPGPLKEIGWYPVYKTDEAKNFSQAYFLPDGIDVFHWHGDTFDIPDGAVHIAKSDVCASQGFIYDKRVIGFQFHLETTRKSAELLVRSCGDEIVPGSYIQSGEEMLSDDSRFGKINDVMDALLNLLIK